jgi:hypothetical protein
LVDILGVVAQAHAGVVAHDLGDAARDGVAHQVGDRGIGGQRGDDDVRCSGRRLAESPHELGYRRLGNAAGVDQAGHRGTQEPTGCVGDHLNLDFPELSGGLLVAGHGDGVVDDLG